MATTSAHPLPALLKVLADPTRLRILALLELEELSVGELCRSLGMAQSRVSNHLRVLRELDLLRERHLGTSTFLRPDLGAGDGVPRRLWATLESGMDSVPEHAADRVRLSAVVAARGNPDFFDRVAGEWDKTGARFRSGQARQRVAASLLPDGLVVADLGCGTGYLARGLLGLAGRVICVDRSAGMLAEAEKRMQPLPSGTSVELRAGELHELPIATDEVDGALAGMVLHHLGDLTDVDRALAEMFRIVRPGGTAVVLELAPHRETWMHEALGDRHLGLDPGEVAGALTRVGFDRVRIEPTDDRYCPLPPGGNDDQGGAPSPPELPLYIVRGRVPRGR